MLVLLFRAKEKIPGRALQFLDHGRDGLFESFAQLRENLAFIENCSVGLSEDSLVDVLREVFHELHRPALLGGVRVFPVVEEIFSDLLLEMLADFLLAHIGVQDKHVLGNFIGLLEEISQDDSDRVHRIGENHASE